MKTQRSMVIWLASAYVFLAGFPAHAAKESHVPQYLPIFQLRDPHGKTHHSQDLAKNQLILIVTAPTLENKDSQEGWEKYLRELQTNPAVTIVFLEDMSPSAFREVAKSTMRRESVPGKGPIVLIDENGEVRRTLRVARGETAVLVYRPGDGLQLTETRPPSLEAAGRIKRVLKIS